MKKLFGIFSLSVLLFSIFTPAFTYATEAEEVAKEILINELVGNLSNGINEAQTFGGETEKIATLIQGKTFQDTLKDMANHSNLGYWDIDYKIEYFIKADSNENMSGAKLVSTGEPVYVWFDDSDGTGIVYRYSEADKIYLNSSIEMMFGNLASLKELDLSYFDSINVGAYPADNNVFYKTDSLKKLTLDGWDFSNFNFDTANSSNFFNGMGDIEYLSMSGCKMPPHSKNFLNYMYNNDLKYLDVTNLDFSNTNDLEYLMYNACGSLETIKGIETWDVSGINNMHGMFQHCNKLETLDLSNFNVSNVTNMKEMFKDMNNLKTIYVSESFNTNKVTNSQEMFKGATQIVGGNGTTYDETKIDKTYAKIDSESTSGYFTDILDREYNINYVIDDQQLIGYLNNTGTYTPRNGAELMRALKPGYELEYWYELGHNEPFVITESTRGDKTLYPKWKALEEKVEETTTESVVYTNNTTVSVGDETTEEVLSGSSTLTLVAEKVKQEEVTAEEDKTTVKESEIKVTSDKKVEYEGGLEVYLEKTENVGTSNETTGKVEGTIKFSAPIAVKIPISSEAEYVKVQVKHEGEEFGFKGLTLNPVNECNNGEAINDKYNGEDVEVKENNGERYATIYTCSASTFVAYTESIKPADPKPSAGGGRVIKQDTKATEQEHNSADLEKDSTTIKTEADNKSTTRSNETVEQKIKKIEGKALTRGEIAVMTNILLEVFPQLIEGNKGLDDVTKACTSYADEKDFTKDEKKAITRLCKLSIMGIHAEDKTALEEFMVKKDATNNEFNLVVNRAIENHNEKDLEVVKEALKKLENDEESVVFGTLYDVFMGIKSIFN